MSIGDILCCLASFHTVAYLFSHSMPEMFLRQSSQNSVLVFFCSAVSAAALLYTRIGAMTELNRQILVCHLC